MEYTQLGRSGLNVSLLALGTMNFGPVTAEEDAFRVLDAAVDAGINVIDTANAYGWSPNQGWTEKIIGRWLAARPGMRDRIVLATKIYMPMGDGPNDHGLSAYEIRREFQVSLERLQTDHIDLYQLHHYDRQVGWDEIWQALSVLVGQGRITYVGSSNFAGWQVAQANETARAHGLLGPVSEQSIYNLTQRTIELEVLPAARAYGMGIFAWSPLGGGLLSGILHRQGGGRTLSEPTRRALEAHRGQVEAYEGLAGELGVSPANLSLAWLLHRPGVTAPIIGPRTLDQLAGALGALDVDLDEGALARLDEIFPGPGGEAPEAYAW